MQRSLQECGVQDGVLFCIDHRNCSKQCDRPCELISSFELRNLNYFAERRIEAIPTESSANDYHFNYFDIESPTPNLHSISSLIIYMSNVIVPYTHTVNVTTVARSDAIELPIIRMIPAWFIYLVVLSAYTLLTVIGLLTYKCCILGEEDVRRMYNYQYGTASYSSWKETPPSNVISRSRSVTSSRTGFSSEEDSE
ncbi:hypothetical protein Tcan_04211 [Toxocara canis]|uniref:Uncharacterized protein n=1 Tax=Toxocara canis TaxID=6265 RepID=A0A0B2V373_TOXCA|nr:hypothetical protein Tcan_04211 [Toxocara canis]